MTVFPDFVAYNFAKFLHFLSYIIPILYPLRGEFILIVEPF
jgi:hypothetical protein